MTLSSDRADILSIAYALKPDLFVGRLEYWRRGGLPAGGSEDQVSRSRSYPLPSLDRVDRELQEALRAYRDNLSDTVRLLTACSGLEAKYLFDIKVASEDVRELATDSASCMCSNTKELWERQRRKTPWRIKRGLGPCCYSSWSADGQPDIGPWLKARRSEEANA